MGDATENLPSHRDCTCLVLSRATRKVHKIYDSALSRHGLSIGQFGLLAMVKTYPGSTLAELADHNVMDPSTVSRLLRPLLARELVVANTDNSDRRIRRVSLTEAGGTVWNKALAGWHAAQAELDGLLGAAFNKDVRQMMQTLVTTL